MGQCQCPLIGQEEILYFIHSQTLTSNPLKAAQISICIVKLLETGKLGKQIIGEQST